MKIATDYEVSQGTYRGVRTSIIVPLMEEKLGGRVFTWDDHGESSLNSTLRRIIDSRFLLQIHSHTLINNIPSVRERDIR